MKKINILNIEFHLKENKTYLKYEYFYILVYNKHLQHKYS